MSETTEHVEINVTVEQGGVPRNGFGKPLILTHKAAFAELTREYADTSDVTDDFDADSPEFLSAQAFFAQKPRPPTLLIGRAEGVAVTLKYELGAFLIADGISYTLDVVGEGFDRTTLTIQTTDETGAAQINSPMLTLLNGVADKNYTAAFAPLVVADLVFTANATDDTLHKTNHGLETGDGPVQVAGGDLADGLLAATDYWAIVVDDDTFQLASSLANALSGTALPINDAGSGTQTLSDTVDTKRPADPLIVTATAPGDWFAIEVAKTKLWHVAMTHTVSGLDTALTNIVEDDDSFYMVHILFPSKDYVSDVSDWCETNNRILVFDVPETDALNTVVGGATDTLATLFGSGPANTMGCFKSTPSQFFAAAWMGRWLPTDPGASNPKFKTLTLVTPETLSQTQRRNLRNRRGNTYTRVAQRNITWEGTVFSTVNKFLDITRNSAWIYDEVQKNIFGKLADAEIVPGDDEGIQVAVGGMHESFDLGVAQGVFEKGTVVITAPTQDERTDEDKSERVLRKVKGSAKFRNAINKVVADVSVGF